MKAPWLMLTVVVLSGCGKSQQFDANTALVGKAALACAGIESDIESEPECDGASVVLTGFPVSRDENGYVFSVEHPDNWHDRGSDDDFFAMYPEGRFEPIDRKVQIAGIVGDGGFLATHPVTTILSVKPAKVTEQEARFVESEPDDGLTPEERIAKARKDGAKALEEWDAAIRQNNADLRQQLAAHAVAHTARSSGPDRIDMYGMPDGRWIACTTKLYSQGAPITTCDGEP